MLNRRKRRGLGQLSATLQAAPYIGVSWNNMIKVVFLTLLSFAVCADDNHIKNNSYKNIVGSWEANWTAVNGELQNIEFTKSGASTFTRKFKDGDVIEVTSTPKDLQILDDIIVFKYYDGDFGIRYKLVLSGWALEDEGEKAKVLYGTLFLYQLGKQFNGFSVSFVPSS